MMMKMILIMIIMMMISKFLTLIKIDPQIMNCMFANNKASLL